MKNVQNIQKSILNELDKKGYDIKGILDKHTIVSFNVMASPGAGKTSLLLSIIRQLKHKKRIAVIEGDIVPIDVETLKQEHIPVVLAQTGGSCHLDSIMMQNALKQLPLDALDIVFVENVGNLICPAHFYLGTHKNIVISSIPEGADKPYKYPAMFQGADLVILNKIDYLSFEPFDIPTFEKGVHAVSPSIPILQTSCRQQKGIDAVVQWIEHAILA